MEVPATHLPPGRFQAMEHHAAHDLRDLLSLARLLRRFAGDHVHDTNHDLFAETAVALEQRARLMAEARDECFIAHDMALHAPVDIRV